MEVVTSFLQILLPAGLVLLGMYVTVQTLVTKQVESRIIELRNQNAATLLPLRLQAAERLVLLLERTAVNNLVLRVNNPVFTVAQLQGQLVSEIREEMGHNLSQQVYVSDEAWGLVKNAIEETIALINTSAQGLTASDPSITLAKAIFENLIRQPENTTERALRYVKEEIQVLF